jgi:hypothetical protein
MARGRRSVVQQKDLFVLAKDMPHSAGHRSYIKLNRLLEHAGFFVYVALRAWVPACIVSGGS